MTRRQASGFPPAARAALRRWKTAWAVSPELLFCFDPYQRRVIDANPAACRALGWSMAHLRRRTLGELLANSPDTWEEWVCGCQPGQPPGSLLRCVLGTRQGGFLEAYGQVHPVPGTAGKERLLVLRPVAWTQEALQEGGNPGDAELARAASGGIDPLTGLANRRRFEQHLEQALAEMRRKPRRTARAPFAVLFVDLDGFKGVNDRFGHLTGDRVLAAIASRIARCVRPGDLVARFGGDEFTVFVDDVGCRQDAESIARRIARHVAEPLRVARQKICLGASVGIALSEEGYARGEAMLEAADRAMFEAKAARGGMAGVRVRPPRSKRRPS